MLAVGSHYLKQARGKLPPSTLFKIILDQLGKPDKRVLVGPRIGEDAAIIQGNGKVLIIHSDPVTGASQDIGRLSVHVSVNDVVSKGADPRWVSLVLLLDPGINLRAIRRIFSQAHQACLEVGAAIIGGHTEVTPTVGRPVIVSTVVGEAEAGKFHTSSGARPGDRIVMTKTAALEGTAILARQFPKLRSALGDKLARSASNFLENISVYPEARIAREAQGVTAMHDVTEGGVLCALQEVAYASGCGFIVDSSRVPIAEETRRICSTLNLDPLKTIGSGALIITTKPPRTRELIGKLEENGIHASEIGEMTAKGQWLASSKGKLRIPRFVREEIWKVLE